MTDFHLSENLETNGLEEDELEIEIKVKDELDRLNAAIKGINQLGKEASNAETLFQNTMKESFTALEDCAREIGVERIERARPYFNEVKLVQRASKRVHLERELCKRIEENEREAKERAKEAEDCCMKMMGNSYVDVDALEALNQAVLDVMNNAFIKASRCHELDKYDKKYTERRKNLAKLQARLRNEIDNARPYYELKNQLNKMLLCKKKRVESIKDGLKSARNVYKASMKKIEEMSEDIHKERGTV
ncbi:SH3 domain-binding protein 5-like [Rhopilema esculentum]|uniref:SH3 domain-binding protein 5-like n=1 Tax=Rhopilema esculentum TaxID=499914 RepID=UPI0031DBB434